MDSLHVNVMAFADDMIFMSQTPLGMHEFLDIATQFLYTTGLEPNSGKCAAVAIKTVPKQNSASGAPWMES